MRARSCGPPAPILRASAHRRAVERRTDEPRNITPKKRNRHSPTTAPRSTRMSIVGWRTCSTSCRARRSWSSAGRHLRWGCMATMSSGNTRGATLLTCGVGCRRATCIWSWDIGCESDGLSHEARNSVVFNCGSDYVYTFCFVTSSMSCFSMVSPMLPLISS